MQYQALGLASLLMAFHALAQPPTGTFPEVTAEQRKVLEDARRELGK